MYIKCDWPSAKRFFYGPQTKKRSVINLCFGFRCFCFVWKWMIEMNFSYNLWELGIRMKEFSKTREFDIEAIEKLICTDWIIKFIKIYVCSHKSSKTVGDLTKEIKERRNNIEKWFGGRKIVEKKCHFRWNLIKLNRIFFQSHWTYLFVAITATFTDPKIGLVVNK